MFKNMKKLTITLTAFSLAMASMTACSGNESSESKETPVQASSAEKSGTSVKEPDLMGFLTGENDIEFIGMTTDELAEATGGELTPENAEEYNDYDKENVIAVYPLGKKDSILGGKVALPAQCEPVLKLQFSDGVLKCANILVENISKEDADKIAENFLSAFDGKLPDGYEQFSPVEHGNHREVGFTKGIDDYAVSVKRDDNLDGEFYANFAIQIYSERYGMK